MEAALCLKVEFKLVDDLFMLSSSHNHLHSSIIPLCYFLAFFINFFIMSIDVSHIDA